MHFPKKNHRIAMVSTLFAIIALIALYRDNIIHFPLQVQGGASAPPAQIIPNVNPDNTFLYTFNTNEILYETGELGQTTSPYWWVDSGAMMIIKNGIGSTVIGSLPQYDAWRLLYARDNPIDTDNGYHPQNIFRLVALTKLSDYIEESYFRIDATNQSASANRNESNGLFLFSRFKNPDNLYYTGIRVDGNAVIKKKVGGVYYTLALNNIFPGTYDRNAAPNLLPQNTWIGLRSVIKTNEDNSVSIQLYMDVGKIDSWKLIAEARDDGSAANGTIIPGDGYGGIRTDFMDVEFSDFQISRI